MKGLICRPGLQISPIPIWSSLCRTSLNSGFKFLADCYIHKHIVNATISKMWESNTHDECGIFYILMINFIDFKKKWTGFIWADIHADAHTVKLKWEYTLLFTSLQRHQASLIHLQLPGYTFTFTFTFTFTRLCDISHLWQTSTRCLQPSFFPSSSSSTTGFKFFQTSVAFHRGMAVQHKAESHHSPPIRPPRRYQATRPALVHQHTGLSSAVTFSGSSHLVSREKLSF